MVTVILPPASALETAAAELGNGADVKRLISVNKGLYDLLTNDAPIVRVTGAYLVPSSSRGGLIHRLDDLAGCSCEAGRAGRDCRHKASIEIIEAAQTRVMPALGDRLARARAAAAAFNAEIFG